MPTARFVVVPAPLEEQISHTLGEQLREAASVALRLRRSVNDTLHDDELGQKASNAFHVVARPGGLPFVLFMLLIAVVCVRELLLRMETKRILKAHQELSGSPEMPPKHQHDD